MKTNTRSPFTAVASFLVALLLLALVYLTTGCSSVSLAKKLQAFDQLGITKAEINGKFSSTDYTRVEEKGVVKSTLNHSNAWLTKVHLERERPAASDEKK